MRVEEDAVSAPPAVARVRCGAAGTAPSVAEGVGRRLAEALARDDQIAGRALGVGLAVAERVGHYGVGVAAAAKEKREAQRSERSSSEFVARVLHPSNGKSLNLASLGVAQSTFAWCGCFEFQKTIRCMVLSATRRTMTSARKPLKQRE